MNPVSRLRAIIASSLLTLPLAGETRAELITFEFSGTVTEVRADTWRPQLQGYDFPDIGDLFTGSVDQVWQPMESLYPADKPPIPPWNAGVDADKATGKANELVLPDGRRP